ncbi:MAG: helix-turn-helix transcriptional regulator [Phenylobacterium zucineum]|nr:MAG: helix-turn-helix transcriptional regulator [Phenylobacterium zucineum]
MVLPASFLPDPVSRHVFRMADDTLTWDEVGRRVRALGRGAPYQLSQALGMNHSHFYRKIKGSTGELTERQARTVRDFLGEASVAPRALPDLPDRRRLPVYGYAAGGGEELIAFNDGDVVDYLDLPMGIELGPGDWFVIRLIGSSMEPRIFPGDPLVVRRKHPPTRGKDVVVEFTDGTAVVKTYYGQRDGQVFVEQWNERKLLNYPAVTVKALHGGIIKL